MRLAPTVMAAFCALACTAGIAADNRAVPDAAQLKSMEARFAPVDVRVDVSYLPAEERAALERLDRSVAATSTRCSSGSARPATNRRCCNSWRTKPRSAARA